MKGASKSFQGLCGDYEHDMRIAQRIEKLTQLVGRIAHNTLAAFPAANISTNDLTATADHLTRTEARMDTTLIALQTKACNKLNNN